METEYAAARVTSKGQITVPKSIRDQLDLTTGDSAGFDVRGSEVVIRRLPRVEREWATSVQTTLAEWQDDLDDEL